MLIVVNGLLDWKQLNEIERLSEARLHSIRVINMLIAVNSVLENPAYDIGDKTQKSSWLQVTDNSGID